MNIDETRLVDRMVENWPAVSELYVSNARIALAKSPPFEPWEQYALACLARAHYTVETIFRIRDREADIVALMRVLYEHAIAFAWLMVDPDSHYAQALSYERAERDKLGKGLGRHYPQANLPEAASLATIALGADPTVQGVPDVFSRADRAEKHWTPKVDGWSFTFVRNYESVYRGYGTSTHATIAGLEPFFDTAPGADPANPKSRHEGQIPAEAMIMLADMLVVAGKSMVGWPSQEELIDTAFRGVEGVKREIEQERLMEAVHSVKDEVLTIVSKLGLPMTLFAVIRRDGDRVELKVVTRSEAAETYKSDRQVTELMARPLEPPMLTFLASDAQSTAKSMGHLLVGGAAKRA
jgi:hypothetical protein